MASKKRVRDEDIPTVLDSVLNEIISDFSESEDEVYVDDDSESNTDTSEIIETAHIPLPVPTADAWDDVSNGDPGPSMNISIHGIEHILIKTLNLLNIFPFFSMKNCWHCFWKKQ